mgnify:FL=1
MTITLHQCRAARALVDYSQTKLALKSGVAMRTIVNFESGRTRRPVKANLRFLQMALEAAGVEFLDQEGVRLKLSPHRMK